jgi:hypothetical protein
MFKNKTKQTDDSELLEKLQEFMGAFEILFHHDWEYSKDMIGDEEKDMSFLNPGLEDETEDWGARGELLEKYRNLRAEMNKRKLKSVFNPHLKSNLKKDGHWKK